MFELPQINPLHTTALHFFDLGDVESPDGRSHPITSTTPVSFTTEGQQPAAPAPKAPKTPDMPLIIPGMGVFPGIPGSGAAIDAVSNLTPKHFGARLAISVLAIGILLIVAFRLAK